MMQESAILMTTSNGYGRSCPDLDEFDLNLLDDSSLSSNEALRVSYDDSFDTIVSFDSAIR